MCRRRTTAVRKIIVVAIHYITGCNSGKVYRGIRHMCVYERATVRACAIRGSGGYERRVRPTVNLESILRVCARCVYIRMCVVYNVYIHISFCRRRGGRVGERWDRGSAVAVRLCRSSPPPRTTATR